MCQTILNSVHLDIICVQNHIQRPEYKILDSGLFIWTSKKNPKKQHDR